VGGKLKLIDAKAIADQVKCGSTLAFPGNLTIMVADALLEAVEKRFLETGYPRDLTVFEPCNGVLDPGTGVERLAHEGLIKRLVCSAFPTFKGGRLAQMIDQGAIEAYNFPMGVLYSLTREIGAGRPGLLTDVGMGTFVDPLQLGGKLNEKTVEELVERVEISGRSLLFYKGFGIDTVFLKATSADRAGNLSYEREPLSLGALSLAIAAKASGGKVFAQVERLVDTPVHPKSVLVPGAFIDGIILAPDAVQSGASRYDPTITGEDTAALEYAPLPLDASRLIISRAAMELRSGALVNLGVGIPSYLPRLLGECGLESKVTFSTEHGAIGGLPCVPPAFGAHVNPEAILDPTDTFNFYTGGVLDITFLGMAQADAQGNVNVSRFNGRNMGVGGFIDITARTRKIVICGTMTAGGSQTSIVDGRVVVEQEGRVRKLVRDVEQITLNGRLAQERGQEVRMVTERGVFDLTPEGWLLIEIYPGIDPQRDIAPMLDFDLRVSPHLKECNPVILQGAGADFSRLISRSLEGSDSQ